GGNQYGLDFYTSFANRMSITNTGKVQVTPVAFVGSTFGDVSLKQTGTVGSNGGYMSEESGASSDRWQFGYGSSDDMDFYWNGALKGYLENVGGTWTNVSDGKLKTDVEPLIGMLGIVDQLDPVKYYFKDTKYVATRKSYGFIAQDVE